MRTAEEMTGYIDKHDLGKGMGKRWRLKHFKVAEKQLNADEEPFACFIGLHNHTSGTKHNGYYAYLITDKRFIMTQKKLIGENVQIVTRKHLNDVTKTTGLLWGRLAFDTIKETFNVGVDKGTVDRVHDIVSEFLFSDDENETHRIYNEPEQPPAAQLKEFKELLDMEVITKEEFDAKKKELLG